MPTFRFRRARKLTVTRSRSQPKAARSSLRLFSACLALPPYDSLPRATPDSPERANTNSARLREVLARTLSSAVHVSMRISPWSASSGIHRPAETCTRGHFFRKLVTIIAQRGSLLVRAIETLVVRAPRPQVEFRRDPTKYFATRKVAPFHRLRKFTRQQDPHHGCGLSPVAAPGE